MPSEAHGFLTGFGKFRGPVPKGLKRQKAEWLKPGLVGRVKFLKGEEKLRHAKLKDFREV